MRINGHPRAEYTPDAYGIQILTDAHLARARSLAEWDVQEMAPARHLVQARDLAPWFADDIPAPEVLAAARHDFGDMILTPEAIAARPRFRIVPGNPPRAVPNEDALTP